MYFIYARIEDEDYLLTRFEIREENVWQDLLTSRKLTPMDY